MSAPTTQRQATGVFSPTRAELPQRTLRTDKWWLPTLWTDLGFSAFVIYATVRAFLGGVNYNPAPFACVERVFDPYVTSFISDF